MPYIDGAFGRRLRDWDRTFVDGVGGRRLTPSADTYMSPAKHDPTA
jgi:hypothetical protein